MTGRTLTKPVMYVPYRDGVLLVASVGGAPKNPVWYRNIIKHPDIEVRHGGRVMLLRARLANETERDSLWPICDAAYSPYADYRSRTSRAIPVLVCQPVDSDEIDSIPLRMKPGSREGRHCGTVIPSTNMRTRPTNASGVISRASAKSSRVRSRGTQP
jgi:deazaflavin-dependent oxidoreductase (nitroreductase family)